MITFIHFVFYSNVYFRVIVIINHHRLIIARQSAKPYHRQLLTLYGLVYHLLITLVLKRLCLRQLKTNKTIVRTTLTARITRCIRVVLRARSRSTNTSTLRNGTEIVTIAGHVRRRMSNESRAQTRRKTV